jgi:amphi-Trp domain-containing protein
MARAVRYLSDLHTMDAADRLSRISLGLVRGDLSFQQDGRRIKCHPGQIVRFGLSVEEDGSRGSLVVEITWRRPLDIVVGGANGHRQSGNTSEGVV